MNSCRSSMYILNNILGPSSNVFFQLVLISWMITLNSCLIWQIISWILLLNAYGCVYAWTTLGNIATLLWKSCAKIAYGPWKKRLTVSFVCSLSCEKVTENGILIDKPNHEKKNRAYTWEYCCYGRKCAWSAIYINSPSFLTIEHFGNIIETNFTYRPWHNAIQSPISSGVQWVLASLSGPACLTYRRCQF